MLRSSYTKDFIKQRHQLTREFIHQREHTKKLIYQGVQIPRSSYTSSYTKEFIHQGVNKSKSSYTRSSYTKELINQRVHTPSMSYTVARSSKTSELIYHGVHIALPWNISVEYIHIIQYIDYWVIDFSSDISSHACTCTVYSYTSIYCIRVIKLASDVTETICRFIHAINNFFFNRYIWRKVKPRG